MDSVDPFQRSNCTPRTPNKTFQARSRSEAGAETPGQKRQINWSPEPQHQVKKPNISDKEVLLKTSVSQNNDCTVAGSSWDNNPSFASIVKNNEELQVAFYTEPQKPLTSGNRLDFIDAMGDLIFASENVLPCFESTICRGNFIIVTATNEFSYQWLLSNAVAIDAGPELLLNAIPASQIPKLKKVLLWLPGRKRLPEAEILIRLGKVNPTISCGEWRVFSRKDEPHGCRLLVGVDEASYGQLKALDMKFYWSTVRGQVTPVDEMKATNTEKAKQRIHSKARRFIKEASVTNKSKEAGYTGESQVADGKGIKEACGSEAVVGKPGQATTGYLSPPIKRRVLSKASGKITSYLKSSPVVSDQQYNLELTNRFSVLQETSENTSVVERDEILSNQPA